ncbi:MAG: AAA family ATPase [Vicinamibacterales bacterium]
MYESYYGFSEKPFSLTPDPKFLYRSQSHGDAFDLLQYAVRRREGFVVVTGDIGTGKTTLCRALLEEIDRTTFTALVLNPFMSEEDLLKRILQDFGVISREDAKAGRLAGVTKQELIDALYDFLLGLIPLKASAVLIIDEAQNLPLPVLEQIRILSNLETDKEKLLQIILVGQLNLGTLLRSPELRQLDQRVSIRYELQPLDREAAGAYVAHRLAIAGGSGSVTFTAGALDEVHARSGGIPRLINLICDRALLSGYSARTSRITPEMVTHAARSLDVQSPPASQSRWWSRRASTSERPAARRSAGRASLAAAACVVLMSSVFGAGASALLYERFGDAPVMPPPRAPTTVEAPPTPAAVSAPASLPVAPDHRLPDDAALTIFVGSYAAGAPESAAEIQALTDWLEASGFPVFYADVDLGAGGRWQRVLAGTYTDQEAARRDVDRLKTAAPALVGHVVSAKFASGMIAPATGEPDAYARRAGTEPCVLFSTRFAASRPSAPIPAARGRTRAPTPCWQRSGTRARPPAIDRRSLGWSCTGSSRWWPALPGCRW